MRFFGEEMEISADNIIHKSSHHPSKYTNCASYIVQAAYSSTWLFFSTNRVIGPEVLLQIEACYTFVGFELSIKKHVEKIIKFWRFHINTRRFAPSLCVQLQVYVCHRVLVLISPVHPKMAVWTNGTFLSRFENATNLSFSFSPKT